jgi:hypothetical protein
MLQRRTPYNRAAVKPATNLIMGAAGDLTSKLAGAAAPFCGLLLLLLLLAAEEPSRAENMRSACTCCCTDC